MVVHLKGERTLNKKALRKNILEQRDRLDLSQKENWDDLIKQNLMESRVFKDCKNIFIYIGFGSEIDTSKYIRQFLSLKKNVLVPRTDIKAKSMEAVQIYNLEDLVEDKYGILEPKNDKIATRKDNIDLIILPGVAFDASGNRVGYGGGYYDRFLEGLNKNIPKVALCYNFQLVESIETEKHDIKADYIITEQRSMICK